jgi:hypothetical protein
MRKPDIAMMPNRRSNDRMGDGFAGFDGFAVSTWESTPSCRWVSVGWVNIAIGLAALDDFGSGVDFTGPIEVLGVAELRPAAEVCVDDTELFNIGVDPLARRIGGVAVALARRTGVDAELASRAGVQVA